VVRLPYYPGYLAQEMAAERCRDSADGCLGLGCLMFIGYRRSFLGVKRSSPVTDHSSSSGTEVSSSGTEVKNGWSCTSTPPLWLHAVPFTVYDAASVGNHPPTFRHAVVS